MKKYFEGRKILSHMTARLLPPDDTYPDSICKLIMTENMLYALDDFGSVPIYHFKIPIDKIISLEERPPGSRGHKNAIHNRLQWLNAFSALTGVIAISGKEPETSHVRLKIEYKNEAGEICTVSFRECSNIMHMVNAFQKYKKRG